MENRTCSKIKKKYKQTSKITCKKIVVGGIIANQLNNFFKSSSGCLICKFCETGK